MVFSLATHNREHNAYCYVPRRHLVGNRVAKTS
ncbi:hypothetical protein T09_9802 [Trichinella sp. T9]|nr:hypothetical protein T09_4030 [Trichinella sp. T9]KRX29491.1 hypothetical protein T09_9802 [Trichinella sp. T9]